MSETRYPFYGFVYHAVYLLISFFNFLQEVCVLSENPIPYVAASYEGSLEDAEQHAVKELVRHHVRDECGSLREVWAHHGQARFFLLLSGVRCPFSYRRCTCPDV